MREGTGRDVGGGFVDLAAQRDMISAGKRTVLRLARPKVRSRLRHIALNFLSKDEVGGEGEGSERMKLRNLCLYAILSKFLRVKISSLRMIVLSLSCSELSLQEI